MPADEVQSILFVELLGGIGDLVLALPAIHGLARTHSSALVTVFTFAPGAELLTADPLIAEVVVARPGPPEAQAAQVASLLARRRFDLVISDTRYGGIPALLEGGRAGRAVTDLWRRPPPDQLIDRRFLEILVAEGVVDERYRDLAPVICLASADRAAARSWLGHVPGRGPVAALVPEAGMAIKEWGPARHGALGRALTALGWRIVVTTGRNAVLSEEIASGVGGATVVPPMPLARLAAVLGEVDLCVAPDTGAARIASAVGTPTVCLFGPTVDTRFGLRPPARNRRSPLPCPERRPLNMTDQPCWWSGRCIFDDRRSCMDDISVEMVLDDVRALERQGVLRARPARAATPASTGERSAQADDGQRQEPGGERRQHDQLPADVADGASLGYQREERVHGTGVGKEVPEGAHGWADDFERPHAPTEHPRGDADRGPNRGGLLGRPDH